MSIAVPQYFRNILSGATNQSLEIQDIYHFEIFEFTSDENDKLMNEVVGERSLTESGYKATAYKKWQEYYIQQAAEIPLTYRYEIMPINKRVKNFRIDYNAVADGWGIHLVELTSDTPKK